MLIKILMLIVFFGIMIGVGLYCRRRVTDVSSFVLGGRAVGPWLTAFAFGTSYFSAVVFVGYAGQFGWKYGIAATWAGIGNALIGSLAAWAILGRRTRIMTQHLDSATMPEFFGKRFGSNGLKVCSSLIAFVFLIPYTASLYNGLSRLFGMAFNMDYTVCIIIMAILTGIYVTTGGYMATAINDFFQGIIMIVGICAVITTVLNSNGGLMGAMDRLARITDESVSTTPGIFASFIGPDPINLLGVVILTSLGTWGLPQMVQKFYAIRSENAVKKGMLISTVFAFIVAGGCYFLGGFGRLYSDKIDITVEGYDAIIPAMISSLPNYLIAVVVMLVLSASMSTLSSLVLTSSSTITIDLIKGNIIKKLDEKKQVFIMRMFVIVFIAISSVIAIYQYKKGATFIAQLMGVSWGALAGAFLAPFLYGLYWKKTTKVSCYVCFIFSTVVMILNMLVRPSFPKLLQSPINAGAFTMLAGLIIVPLVSIITPAPDSKMIDDAFNCYDEKVFVSKKSALEDNI